MNGQFSISCFLLVAALFIPSEAWASPASTLCSKSRAGKHVVTSVYSYSLISQLLTKRSTPIVNADLTAPNTNYISKAAGMSSAGGNQFDYFQPISGGATLVVASQNRFGGKGGFVKTVAVGDLGDNLITIDDPAGVLIRDTRDCVEALAGISTATSSTELDYAIDENMRRVYGFDEDGQVQWIGISGNLLS
jgi:hypothetical protein